MKSNRTKLSVLAFLALSFLAFAAAHALPDCEFICSCGTACSARCTPGPGLPTLSCGEWGYDCIGSPNCSLATSAESTCSTSFLDSDLQRIFSSSTPVASVPAQGR